MGKLRKLVMGVSVLKENRSTRRVWLGVLFIPWLLAFSTVTAQPRKLPPFRMVTDHGAVFKAEELPLSKPVVLIYFSPDCDHCQTLMRDYFARAREFDKASVVMITYLPPERVTRFCRTYHTQQYPNLFVGTEGTGFFVRNYYSVKTLPFAAVHDRSGHLIKTYNRDIPLNEIAALLKKMK